jgi:hypothetical protein
VSKKLFQPRGWQARCVPREVPQTQGLSAKRGELSADRETQGRLLCCTNIHAMHARAIAAHEAQRGRATVHMARQSLPPPVAGMGVAGSVQGIGESDSSQWMMWIRLAVNNKFLGWPRVGCLTHQASDATPPRRSAVRFTESSEIGQAGAAESESEAARLDADDETPWQNASQEPSAACS